LRKLLNAAVELRLDARRPALAHAGRAIEEDERGVGPSAADKAERAASQRAGDCEHERGHGKHAGREDEPLPDAGVAARHAVGLEQEAHGAPIDILEPSLVDEVNDDRQGRKRQADQQQRLEKAHRTPPERVRPTRKRIKTLS
jgi:hypothetical protein